MSAPTESTRPRPLRRPRFLHRPGAMLAVLFCGTFAMGCAETLVFGMLDLIAADLQVPIPTAGMLVTANTLGIAIGGPLLALATARWDRRTVLLGALAGFVLLTLIPVAGADFGLFAAARVVTGAVQGLFIAAAFVTATAIVPPDRAGRAMAIVIAGFATSNAFGLPLGTLLGQAVGWRWSFAVVVVVGAVLLVLARAVTPAVPPEPATESTGLVRFAVAPRVLAALGVGTLIFAGIQSLQTYLVPYLKQVSGVPGQSIGVFLLAFGMATTIGSLVGGRLADWNAGRALTLACGGTAGALLALSLFGAHPWAAAACVLAIGVLGTSAAPALQHRAVHLAGPAAALVAALPASTANLGDAIGASAGGLAITAGGIGAVATVGAAIAGLATLAARLTERLQPPVSPAPDSPSSDGGTPERKEASWQA